MNSLDRLGIFLARLLTVSLWVLTVVALNEGLYGGALVVGALPLICDYGLRNRSLWEVVPCTPI
jgi:hypothetical protein